MAGHATDLADHTATLALLAEGLSITFAHSDDEAMPLLNKSARNQRTMALSQKHINLQTKFPSVLGYTLFPFQIEGRCFRSLEIFRSKAITLQLYWLQVSYFMLPNLKYPWGEGRKKKELINNLNSSLVDHCGKLTRLIKRL